MPGLEGYDRHESLLISSSVNTKTCMSVDAVKSGTGKRRGAINHMLGLIFYLSFFIASSSKTSSIDT